PHHAGIARRDRAAQERARRTRHPCRRPLRRLDLLLDRRQPNRDPRAGAAPVVKRALCAARFAIVAGMLRSRDFLIGAGAAAAGDCAPKWREPASATSVAASPTAAAPVAAPAGAAAHWAPYRDAISIDGAGGIWLLYPEDMPPDEVAKAIAGEVDHARA